MLNDQINSIVNETTNLSLKTEKNKKKQLEYVEAKYNQKTLVLYK